MNARPFPGDAEASTFLRFLCVGGSATLLQYVLLVTFVVQGGWLPVLASSLAYALSALYNYLMNRAFTFRTRRAHASALPRFILVSTIGLGLNALVVWLAFDRLHLHYLWAQVLATLVTLGWNYTGGRVWAFAR